MRKQTNSTKLDVPSTAPFVKGGSTMASKPPKGIPLDIEPEQPDFARCELLFGELPADATAKQKARRRYLAQVAAAIRKGREQS
jgi:hypothetical protein